MERISAEQLAARLKQGKAPAAVLLYGSDAYLRESCRNLIIEAVVEPAVRQWAVEHFSGAEHDIETVIGRARTMPMLAARQVIVFSEAGEIEAGAAPKLRRGEEESDKEEPGQGERDEEAGARPESQKADATDLIREYLKSPPPFTVLVLEAAELDKRTKLARMLLAEVLVVSAELPKEPAARLGMAAQQAKKMVAQQQGAMEDDAAEELADLCNCDLAAIRMETAKLAAYAGGRRITRADVEELVVSEKKYKVWELAEVLARGELSRALELVDTLLRDGDKPPALVGALAWTFRQGQQRGWPPQATAGPAPMVSRQVLARSMKALYEADSRLKSAARDDRAIMEFLLSELAGSARAAGRKN